MTLTHVVLAASILCLALKYTGYLVPSSLLERATPARVADLLTVALLAALVATQAFGRGMEVVLDARVPALVVAAVLFAVRVPFLVVVIVAGAVAAVIRAIG